MSSEISFPIVSKRASAAATASRLSKNVMKSRSFPFVSTRTFEIPSGCCGGFSSTMRRIASLSPPSNVATRATICHLRLARPLRGSIRPRRAPVKRRRSSEAPLIQGAGVFPEALDLRSDLLGGLPVALCALRHALEAHRLSPDDRRRVEIRELPFERAGDRAADNGHVLLERNHRSAGLHLPENAGLLPRPLDEHAEHTALTHDLAHTAHCVTVGLAAANRERAERADELAEARDAVRLDLRDVVRVPRVRIRKERDVDPRQVVERNNEPALARDVLLPVHLQPRRGGGERAERVPPERPEPVGVAHAAVRSRTIATIRSTTSSTRRCVVSISCASAAGCIRSASWRSRSLRSVASASRPIPGRSAMRRFARSAWSATR